MAQALFINRDDITRFTATNGNVDVDKFIQFVKIAHDIHLQSYLGTDLFNKISTDIVNNTLSGNYLSLVNNYIKPMAIHWSMVEYLPFAAYSIANKGVYKHGSENAENISDTELYKLVEKQRDIAQHYTQRFLDYICDNSDLFPEYNSNSGSDMYPNKNNFFGGWVLTLALCITIL